MFSLQVVDTDKFLDMPASSQALYFHLGMHGDDDGFVASPRKIARCAGCNDDDMRLLASKGFIIPFESGVLVITDWRVNNTLQNDRYKETIYRDEKSMLRLEKSGKYVMDSTSIPECIQNGSNMESQRNVTQRNPTEQNETECGATHQAHTRFSPPSVDEVREYCIERGYTTIDPERFVSYYAARQWMAGQTTITDWQAAVDSWNRKDMDKNGNGKSESKPLWTVGTVV